MKPARPKLKVTAEIKLDGYRILQQAVEGAILLGYRRAHKNTDKPGEDVICEYIENAVMNDISELMAHDD